MYINPDFARPILNLANSLTKHNVPHTINVNHDGLQIRFPWSNGDFICHSGSYGHEHGYVESMNCPWDGGDVTTLEVEDALKNTVKWYNEIQK